MAARQIGTTTFDVMGGTVDLPGDGLEVFQRPGRDGHRSRVIGLRATPSAIATVKFVANASAAKSTREGYASLRGTIVTVYDADGVQADNVTVVDVTITGQRAVAYCSTLGSAGIKLDANWTLLAGEQ